MKKETYDSEKMRADYVASIITDTNSNNHQKIWIKEARKVFESIVLRVQSEKFSTWENEDIFNIVSSNAEIKKSVEQYCSDYSEIVADIDSKATQAIILTMREKIERWK